MEYGSKAADGRFLNFDVNKAREILKIAPNAKQFIFPTSAQMMLFQERRDIVFGFKMMN